MKHLLYAILLLFLVNVACESKGDSNKCESNTSLVQNNFLGCKLGEPMYNVWDTLNKSIYHVNLVSTSIFCSNPIGKYVIIGGLRFDHAIFMSFGGDNLEAVNFSRKFNTNTQAYLFRKEANNALIKRYPHGTISLDYNFNFEDANGSSIWISIDTIENPYSDEKAEVSLLYQLKQLTQTEELEQYNNEL